MSSQAERALPINGELSLSVERRTGFDCVCVGILSAAGVEHIEAQRQTYGGLLVKLNSAFAVGSPVMVRFSSPGQTPLEILGCVVYELPTGAVIKLDMSTASARGCWEAIVRSWKAPSSRSVSPRAEPQPAAPPPPEPFKVAASGFQAHLSADPTRATLTLSASTAGALRAFARALSKGTMIQTPPELASASSGMLEIQIIADGVQTRINFAARVLCALPGGGMIVDPTASASSAADGLERLIEAFGKARATSPDSGSILAQPTPPQTRSKPLARPTPPPSRPAGPPPPSRPVPPRYDLAATSPPPPAPDARPAPSPSGHGAPRPLEILRAARVEAVDPRVLALRRERDALSALSPYEILGCHWSSYQAVLETSHKGLRARYMEQSWPPEIRAAASEAVNDIVAVLDGALDALSEHKKRLVWRFKNINDDQIQTAVAHYLEQGKLYAWRRDHEMARDSFRRVFEIDPLNDEARKHFKSKE